MSRRVHRVENHRHDAVAARQRSFQLWPEVAAVPSGDSRLVDQGRTSRRPEAVGAERALLVSLRAPPKGRGEQAGTAVGGLGRQHRENRFAAAVRRAHHFGPASELVGQDVGQLTRHRTGHAVDHHQEHPPLRSQRCYDVPEHRLDGELGVTRRLGHRGQAHGEGAIDLGSVSLRRAAGVVERAGHPGVGVTGPNLTQRTVHPGQLRGMAPEPGTARRHRRVRCRCQPAPQSCGAPQPLQPVELAGTAAVLGDPGEPSVGEPSVGESSGREGEPLDEAAVQHPAVHGELRRVQLLQQRVGLAQLLGGARSVHRRHRVRRSLCHGAQVRARRLGIAEARLGEPPEAHRSVRIGLTRRGERVGDEQLGEHVVAPLGERGHHRGGATVHRREVVGEPGSLVLGRRPPPVPRRRVVEGEHELRQVEALRVDSEPRSEYQSGGMAHAQRRALGGRQGARVGQIDEGIDQPAVPADPGIELSRAEQVIEQGLAAGVEQLSSVQPREDVIAEIHLGAIGEDHERGVAAWVAGERVEDREHRRARLDANPSALHNMLRRPTPEGHLTAADADRRGRPGAFPGQDGANPLQHGPFESGTQVSDRHRRNPAGGR
jgi:hypothetical protein